MIMAIAFTIKVSNPKQATTDLAFKEFLAANKQLERYIATHGQCPASLDQLDFSSNLDNIRLEYLKKEQNCYFLELKLVQNNQMIAWETNKTISKTIDRQPSRR